MCIYTRTIIEWPFSPRRSIVSPRTDYHHENLAVKFPENLSLDSPTVYRCYVHEYREGRATNVVISSDRRFCLVDVRRTCRRASSAKRPRGTRRTDREIPPFRKPSTPFVKDGGEPFFRGDKSSLTMGGDRGNRDAATFTELRDGNAKVVRQKQRELV